MKLFTKRAHKDMLIERLFSNLISELKYSEKVTAAISKVLAGQIGTIGNYTHRSVASQQAGTAGHYMATVVQRVNLEILQICEPYRLLLQSYCLKLQNELNIKHIRY
jgi:hypothetical protein